jgi:protein required for attachment to host cells
MYRACIAVVDASRARLFTFERSADPGGLRENLVEQQDLVEPSRRLRDSEVLSETRSGLARTGSLQYGLDDGRDARMDLLEAGFARAVVHEACKLLRVANAQRLILCASPSMLGELRRVRTELPEDVAVDEVPRNLVALAPSELRERLASYAVLPSPPPRA